MATIRFVACALIVLAAGLLLWVIVKNQGPPMLPGLLLDLFATGNAIAVIALSRRADSYPGKRLPALALSLILTGIVACIAIMSAEFWEFLLIPPRSEWHDSLPGLGRFIIVFETLFSVAGAGLVAGWGLWGVSRLVARRRAR